MPHKLSASFHQWLVELRRQFHQFPELRYEEEKTAIRICDTLKSFNIPFQTQVGKTGVVARVRAKHDGPVVAFRADMDALPLDEANDVSYKSRCQGLMHACGHDAHMTIALGVIRWLLENDWPQKGAGEILFIFQPAEEGGAGARAMLDSGVFDKEPVQAIFAGHVFPDLPVGDVGIVPGMAHAAVDTVTIHLKGKGGHGAYPHQCKDPIVAGSCLVTQIQTLISRDLPPLENAVFTIGKFHSGTASNIIPEQAVLEGTLRTLNPGVRENILKRLEKLLKGLEISFDISATTEVTEGYPVVLNHPELASYMETSARELLGTDHVHIRKPSMGAEDFAYFCQTWKGIMINIGCRDPQKEFQHGLHSPYFNIDENVLDVGTWFFGHILTQYIEKLMKSP
ncbi:M20 metallopeptidase family protein [Desulfonema magnum]|uniref:Amidohydrolase n=1 Tax=Desulfonema magnum TaxID=45655 RepID=A0A975BMR4_9BACT|nr:M20 family metallopeptidase [Desulfonema magnum]QTA88402.1 Amidohydrolase [Desulfonema magnum]